jgi:hypothetical protein
VSTFEALCREWLLLQARTGKLPFPIEAIGSHWGGRVQVDVVAINCREKAILLGEVKRQVDTVRLPVVKELIEQKAPLVLKTLPDEGKGWQDPLRPAAAHHLGAGGWLAGADL